MRLLSTTAFFLALSSCPVCPAQSEVAFKGGELSPPSRVVSYRKGLSAGDFAEKWTRGFLIAYRYENVARQTEPNVRIFDHDGNLVGETRLWVDGASLIRIYDVAASLDGRLGIVGSAVDAGGSLAWFFADVSTKVQRPVKIVHTSPFEPRSVVFANDETVWLLGAESGPGRVLRDGPDHFLVEHLGEDDVLKGEYVKRSEIPCAAHPAGGGLVRILTSDDRVGLFLPNCDYWIELKPDGDLIGKWHWNRKLPSGNSENDIQRRVQSVALTSDGQLYANIEEPKDDSVTAGLFRLDRERDNWLPVNTAAVDAAGAPVGWVQGADGTQLVYFSTDYRVVWTTAKAASR